MWIRWIRIRIHNTGPNLKRYERLPRCVSWLCCVQSAPCKHPIIILKGIRWSELRHIVEYMYKGEISVSHEDIDSILQAAESLQVCRCFSLDVQLPIRIAVPQGDIES